MEKELLDLLLNNDIKINKNFINNIINIVIYNNDIGNYVDKPITFISKKTSDNLSLASYDVETRKIKINLFNTQQVLISVKKNNMDNTNIEIIKKLFIIKNILHEVEHAKQLKKAKEGPFDDESKIIRTTFEIGKEKGPLIYLLYYDINPVERLADIRACGKIVNILKQEKAMLLKIYLDKFEDYILALLGGYKKSFEDDLTCPTEAFLFENCKQSTWETFDFYDSNKDKLLMNVLEKYPNFQKRLSLGLPITEKEKNENSNYLNI